MIERRRGTRAVRGRERGRVRRGPRLAVLALAVLGLLVAAPASAGYYLSAEIEGPPAARSPASSAMSEGTSQTMPPPLPGLFVGHVDDLAAALAWVDRWAFAGPPLPGPEASTLSLGPAPIPGGALLDGFGVHLLGLQVDEAGGDGSALGLGRWPAEPPLPSRWRPAALLALRAPLFAAPAPSVPPAHERHALLSRRDDLFVLGVVDRCAGDGPARRCLRWAQVLARADGRFTAGYLPIAQIALRDGWIRGKGGLPRVHVALAGVAGDVAQFVLVTRTRKSELHQATIELPLAGGQAPVITTTVEGEEAILTGAGEPLRVPLTAALDARPR